MKNSCLFPKEWLNFSFDIQNRSFLLRFQSQAYQAIAQDDVGNFIAVSPTGQICLLICDTSQIVESAVYAAPTAEQFAQQIQVYSHYIKTACLPENPTDCELQAYETNFRNLILQTDPHAFDSECNFWATIAEEMGYGI